VLENREWRKPESTALSVGLSKIKTWIINEKKNREEQALADKTAAELLAEEDAKQQQSRSRKKGGK